MLEKPPKKRANNMKNKWLFTALNMATEASGDLLQIKLQVQVINSLEKLLLPTIVKAQMKYS
jgi:hypothetical protein